MAGRIVRWGAVLTLGAVWWWAVVRVAVAPDAGVLEGTVAAGGWGLSLLPVHTVSKARAAGAVGTGRWRAAWRAADAARASAGAAGASVDAAKVSADGARASADATRASPPRRSGAGSDPS
nr:hypothetical protein [Streptomyces sp. TSRI0107]